MSPGGGWAVMSNYSTEQFGHTLSVLQRYHLQPAPAIVMNSFQSLRNLWFISDSLLLATTKDRQALLVAIMPFGKIRRVIATG